LATRTGDLAVLFLLLFLLLAWSSLGLFVVLVGLDDRFHVMVAVSAERALGYLESHLRGAILYFIVPPVLELAFIAVAFSGPRKPWTSARCWRLVMAGYGVLFLLFSLFGLLLMQSTIRMMYSDLTASTQHLESQVTAIYVTTALGFALWLVASVLFMFLPTHLKLVRAQQR
jgi:hypothetical protein